MPPRVHKPLRMCELYPKIAKMTAIIRAKEVETFEAGLHRLQGQSDQEAIDIRTHFCIKREIHLQKPRYLLRQALPAGIKAGFGGEVVAARLRDLFTQVEDAAYWDQTYRGDVNNTWVVWCHFEVEFDRVGASLEQIEEMAAADAGLREYEPTPASAGMREYSAPPPPPLSPITIEDGSVLVKGRPVMLKMTRERLQDVLHYLGQLIEHCGQWISGPDISRLKPERYDVRYRWDRTLGSLPQRVRKHIDTDRRKGYRLNHLPCRK